MRYNSHFYIANLFKKRLGRRNRNNILVSIKINQSNSKLNTPPKETRIYTHKTYQI